MFDETLFKNSSDLDLVNYNFVRCNLEAFGKKVASRPGVLRTLVSQTLLLPDVMGRYSGLTVH